MADTPLVMVGHEGSRRVVVAADAAARAAGVGVGTPATKAQALVPGLVIQNADPDDDGRALERLAEWALRYSPIAAAAAPDGIVVDTTGADHLHGGERSMLSDVLSRLRQAGFMIRAAISDTWGTSHALARFSADDMAIAPVGAAATSIAGLPVAALRLDADTQNGLRKLGFRTVGELAATPRAPLTLRFGPEVCRRLDQAHGRIREPIDPVRTLDIAEVRRAFPEPIAAPETLHRYTGKLVGELAGILEERGLGARRLDLLFHCVDNRIETIRIGTSTPTRDVKRLNRLLCDKIENVDPGFGIELMRLAATRAEPLRAKQFVSLLADDADADVSDLIDVLGNRVGAAQVYRYAPVASDVPERAIARVPAASADAVEDWPSGWPRPSRLLRPAERIETVALLPDHPPVAFTWRGIRHRVRRADGPERVFGEWWKGDAELVAVRDYFQVEDETGERFWIYRSGDGEHALTGTQDWFMHGIFA